MAQFSIVEIMEKAKVRPEGYVEALRKCAKTVGEVFWEFDPTAPCWGELIRMYRPAPPQPLAPKPAGEPKKKCGKCGLSGKRLK